MSQQRQRKSKTQRNRTRIRNRRVALVIFLFCGILIWGWGKRSAEKAKELLMENEAFPGAPPFEVMLLDYNEYSRPGLPLEQVNGVVIHYTANPGSTALDNRNYFENLKDSHDTKVSSHFVVGIEGEIIQCVPSTEVAYASNSRNGDTLSIECCHPDDTGEFTEKTYASLVRLTGWLCQRFNLSSQNVIRHYDVTGKNCPKYFVEHTEKWEQFKKDVDEEKERIEKAMGK